MALLVVAGAVGRVQVADPAGPGTVADVPPLSFRWGVIHGIGGYGSSAILLLFGLAALAPACYATWVFSFRFANHWPGLSRMSWTWIGDGIALLLIALSQSNWLTGVDRTMGLLFAPAIGAMTGDFLGQRGGWAGVRRGVNAAGMLAWAGGLALQWSAEFVVSLNPESLVRLIPSPILGFAIAAILYRLAAIGMEGTAIPLAAVENPGPSSAIRSDELISTLKHQPDESPGSEPTSPEARRGG
jgi:cytosine permease